MSPVENPSDGGLPRPTALAHELVAGVLRTGDFAVDATAGNGWDTLFLAGCVGSNGRVLAIDPQPEALDATARLLCERGAGVVARLICGGHEAMAAHVESAGWTDFPVSAVMFNLGYLPGGDKAVTTREETTIPALQQALDLLRPGGLLTVVCYPGHPAGFRESAAVQDWAAGLPREQVLVVRYGALNTRRSAPFLLAIRKNPAD